MGKGAYMVQKNNAGFDWRDITGFDYTNHFSKQDWAWEFLRANLEYQHDYIQSQDERPAVPPVKPGLDNITVKHQKPSDIKAGEWGLLNFR